MNWMTFYHLKHISSVRIFALIEQQHNLPSGRSKKHVYLNYLWRLRSTTSGSRLGRFTHGFKRVFTQSLNPGTPREIESVTLFFVLSLLASYARPPVGLFFLLRE